MKMLFKNKNQLSGDKNQRMLYKTMREREWIKKEKKIIQEQATVIFCIEII